MKRYYSLPISYSSEGERFCSTGYFKNDTCAKGPKIKSPGKTLPYFCKRNSTFIEKCEYSESDGNVFQIDCQCGINSNGHSYCPLGKGNFSIRLS